jgi:hypothetical protein
VRIDWSFLDTFNSTAFKGWSSGWLWVFTAAVWGAATLIAVVKATDHLPTEWLFAWLSGLATYSGLSVVQFNAMRKTDYGALDRQAEIEKAKATPPKDGA